MAQFKSLLFTGSLLLGGCTMLRGQASGPVATTYRAYNNTYYICNYFGKNVMSLDVNNNKDTFITGLTAPNNILFASLPLGEGFIVLDSNEVKGYDTGGTYYASFTTSGAQRLYDAVFDEIAEALYITDIDRGVIYKTTFGAAPLYLPNTVIFSTPYRRPSAMVLQKSKNRILYLEDTLGSNLMAMNLSTGQTSKVISLGIDNCVGLAEDGQGNLYISSQGAKAIYQLNKFYSGSLKKLVTEPKPGDLLTNLTKDRLVYTCILCGTVFVVPIHSFGPGTELEMCPETSYTAYRNVLIKNIGTFDAGNTFVMELSDNKGSFVSPYFLGSVKDTVIPDSILGQLPPNLSSGTGYRYRWRSTKPAINGSFGTLAILPAPNITVSGFDTVQACIASKIRLGESNIGKNYVYQWSPTNVVDSPSNAAIWHTVDSLVRIDLLAMDTTNGCTAKDFTWVKPVSIPDPGPLTDTLFVCKGSSVLLGTTPNGAFTYAWSPGNLLDDSSKAQPKYSGTSDQTFQLTLTAAGGCKNSFTQQVHVRDLPVFSVLVDTVRLCYPKSQLNSIVPSSSNYRCVWYGPGPADSTVGDSRGFSWDGATSTVRVVYTDLNSGCSAEKTVEQIHIPRQTVTLSKVQNTLVLNETLTDVKWYRNDTLYKTDSLSIFITKSGQYKACGTGNSGCPLCTGPMTIFINGINQIGNSDCHIYPMPTDGILHLECMLNQTGSWRILSLEGRELKTGAGETADMADLADGVYILVTPTHQMVKILKSTP